MVLRVVITVLSACTTGFFGVGLTQERSADQLVTLLGEIRKEVDQEVEGSRSSLLARLAEVQARAGLHKDAEETFNVYVALLSEHLHGNERDGVALQISLLSKMSLASEKAGDHNVAVQYLLKSLLLAQSKFARRTAETDHQLIMSKKAKFQEVLELALRLQEATVADEVAAQAREMISGFPDAEFSKSFALAEFLLARANMELSLGQKDSARTSTQSLLLDFRDYITAYPCNVLPEVAALQAELGGSETAVDNMNRCFAWRDRILKDHPEDISIPDRYRFYNSRDLASVASAAWRGSHQKLAIELFEKALTLGKTTPFDDQFFYWRQLVGAAAEMRRFDVIEEAISKGYHNDDWALPWYPNLMQGLLDADRYDLIQGLGTDESNVAAIVRVQVERGDYRNALKTGEGVITENAPPHVIRDFIHAYAAVNGVQEAINWSRRCKNSIAQLSSLLGVVDHLTTERSSINSQ